MLIIAPISGDKKNDTSYANTVNDFFNEQNWIYSEEK